MEPINLPVKPIPFPDESAASLLIRTAAANGHESVHRLFALVLERDEKMLNHGDLHDSSQFNALVKLLGFNLSSDLVYPKLIPSFFSDVFIGGVKYPHSFFRKDGVAFCPDCIKESKYLKNIWRFIPYSICHVHGKEIITICRRCKKETNAFRGAIDYCKKCDAELPNSPQVESTRFRVLFEGHIFRSQDAADYYKNLWQFVAKFIRELHSSLTPCKINEIIYEMYNNHNRAANLLVSSIYQNVRISNPHNFTDLMRLDFNLPESFCKQLIYEMLNREDLKEWEMYEQAAISKKRAAEILKISYKKLNNYIDKKVIDWPAISNREAKAPLNIINDAGVAINQKAELIKPRRSELPEGYMDLMAVASELMIQTQYVRSICNRNWLKSEDLFVDGLIKSAFLKKDVVEFTKKYVLVGTFAKEIEVNPRNLAEKLQSVGISPIAGPSIDGLVTSLFRRADLENISKELIMNIKIYKTKTGRKPKGYRKQENLDDVCITLSEASKLLEVSQQKISVLVRRGILKKSPLNHARISIILSSVDFLRKQLTRYDLVKVDDACRSIGCTKSWFYINIVKKNLAEIFDYKYWVLVCRADVVAIEKMKKGNFTAYEGSLFLGRHRCHLNNLKKQGLVTPIHLTKDEKGLLDFYPVEKINFLRLKNKFGK